MPRIQSPVSIHPSHYHTFIPSLPITCLPTLISYHSSRTISRRPPNSSPFTGSTLYVRFVVYVTNLVFAYVTEVECWVSYTSAIVSFRKASHNSLECSQRHSVRGEGSQETRQKPPPEASWSIPSPYLHRRVLPPRKTPLPIP